MSQSIAAKAANTALVRMMRAGKLSAPSIARAAGAMEPGKFRYVSNLGRGQFNMADKVVGNVGGFAGQMARKLPSHAYVDPSDAYKGLKPFVDQTNKAIPTPTGAPLIAPYTAVNNRGAFQQLANQTINTPAVVQGHVDEYRNMLGNPAGLATGNLRNVFQNKLPQEAFDRMGDLHDGNLGPGGQIIDFTAPGIGWAGDTAQRISNTPTALHSHIPGGHDLLANLKEPTPVQMRQNQQVNNAIRAFYGMPEAQRAEMIPTLASRPSTMVRGSDPFAPTMSAPRRVPPRPQRPPAFGASFGPADTAAPSALPPPPGPRIDPWWLVGGGAAGGGGLLGDYLNARAGQPSWIFSPQENK
jgi:hypothetical protein